MDHQIQTELIPGLPEEISLECLTRVHFSAHEITSRVSRRWLELVKSKEFYSQRKQKGRTHKLACFIQSIIPLSSDSKQPPSYGLSLFDPVSFSNSWERVDPIPKYPNGLPMFCGIASTQGKLFIIGGWNPSTWQPVKDVFMYEFTTRKWTQCADMPSTRSFFAVAANEGRIFVAGGHDEYKNALNSALVFDVKSNEWVELAQMNEARDECEGIVVGSEFWVVSGYETESQGSFKNTAEIFDPEKGEWTRVEYAWRELKCPKSCVGGVGDNGRLINWSDECESSAAVCGVDLGDRVVVTGSGIQGTEPGQGVFVAEKSNSNEGQIGKFIRRTQIPDEFLGFVQSGCFVEI